ncbi:hypothetical protein A8709_32920 [Paenibacillus pectinilyticus]|uniref:YopX protein domain-containing protein n=1 Tax=Paenibacillus pectinilyticus TaxID=512399 RepID=A0A1C0ZWY8_9BACL|nr:YopX family protein [Paenibacillus pectinilyticus]OCT12615.1 hypothetical protein A8709_32920 [Paenibacillus pectinilyticus]
MREIRFRAWDNVADEMLYAGEDFDVIFMLGSSGIECTDVRNGSPSGDGIDSMEHLIYMQWTGLNDSNGDPIYEGDIVGCESNGVERYQKRVICYDIHQAKYKTVPRSTYYANAGHGGWTGYELRAECEVLGNIHENPELLEGKA